QGDFAQILLQLRVGRSVPQARSQVVFDDAEEAGADLAVGREADTVAVAAKRLAHGRNDADLAAPAPNVQRRAVSAGFSEATGRRSKRARKRRRISRPGTTSSRSQARAESSGMNSIKRKLTSFRRPNSASSSISWSVTSRLVTALTLIGCSLSSCARRMLASNSPSPSRPVIF